MSRQTAHHPPSTQGVENFFGVILAGGQSRRMGGGDKGLMRLGDAPLLLRVAERLAAQTPLGWDGLRLNANGEPGRFDPTFKAAGRTTPPVAADSVNGFVGPLAGVLAGLDAAADAGVDGIITAAADTPFFPANLAARLRASQCETGAPIVLAATRDREGALRAHPTFGLWPRALADDLRRALADEGLRKVVAWTDRHGAALAEFPVSPTHDPFFNVNTPEDMAAATRLLEIIKSKGEDGL